MNDLYQCALRDRIFGFKIDLYLRRTNKKVLFEIVSPIPLLTSHVNSPASSSVTLITVRKKFEFETLVKIALASKSKPSLTHLTVSVLMGFASTEQTNSAFSPGLTVI